MTRALRPGEVGKVRSWEVGPGSWRGDALYCGHDGVVDRVRKRGRTESAARRSVLNEVEDRLRESGGEGVSASTKVSEAVEIYMQHRMTDARAGIGRANPRSVRIYGSVATNWIVPFLGNLEVRDVSSGRLDRYFRHDVPAGRYTDVRKVLHGFVKWLIVQGALDTDPVAYLPSYLRSGHQRRSKDQAVGPEDLAAVVAAVDRWTQADRPGPRPSTVYRDLVLFIAATACRPGEALAVRRCDVDLAYEVAPGVKKPVVHVTGTIVYDKDEGGLFRQPHTKSNGAGDRTVVLPDFVLELVRRRLMAAMPGDETPLFATRRGGWLSLNNINSRFRESILKDTEVAEWFELRLMRSATGTAIARTHGADAAAAQMGNTREVAEAHYIHKDRLAPDRSAEIQLAWGESLGGD